MKKILKSICLALVLIGGAMSVTSCDDETINRVLGLLLGGTPSTYSGTATIECLQGTYEPMNYKSVAKGSATIQVTVATNTLSSTATLTIQGVTVGDVQLGEITLSNLLYTANQDNTQCTLSLGESSSILGTFTYNGALSNGSNAYIGTATVNASSAALDMTLYYGDEMTEAVNLKFSGKVVQAQQ
ncbi:MAG: hypothetical protein K5945_09985 [Bacteroidaceae bacterium]|nr:hypothetical protein [Bacteroidaceae bacterium]